MPVLTGIDRLIADPWPIAGRRVGLLTNPSGVTRDLIPTLDVFRAATDFTLAALFSPEHGLAAAARDGEAVASSVDPVSGVPIHSLYGGDANVPPATELFAALDAVVCDLQDIGARFYTYFWTLTLLMEGAGAAGVPVIVLDRPNPIGPRIDGPMLDPALYSLVGRAPMPIQHGMTIGELARWFNDQHNPAPVDLIVIPCEGLTRDMSWEAMDLPFVPPSPAMAHIETARHYPGACLIEGTTLSEGRGTALPFEILGAPGIDGDRLARHLHALADSDDCREALAGVRWRPHAFQPTAGKHAGAVCGGVQAHITHLAWFRPVAAWLMAIRAVHDLFPDVFGWRILGETYTFDRLYGSAAGRAWVESGEPLTPLLESWAGDHAEWSAMRGA
jgi:uncharacterized protein YbbC (DUF1343 family)